MSYHAILLLALPFLYATLYSSKRVMRYVFGLTIISTFVSVYGSYCVGLCDANMLLLTAKSTKHYIVDDLFVSPPVNANPIVTLALFYVLPRCLICIAIMFVCNSIVEIISGSHRKTEQMFVQTVTALSEAVDAKDRYTSGHSKRVAEYSRKIAERMGKSKAEQEEIYRAGLLHDVSKIRIPEDIINKTSRLTEEEYNIIKIHPVTGYHINAWIKMVMSDEPRYEVITAGSGAEALAILTEQHIDLILLDVVMQEMDGLETLRQIRENLNTPVVLLNEEKHLRNAAYGCLE